MSSRFTRAKLILNHRLCVNLHMRSKNKQYSNFSQAVQATSHCFRPDTEEDIGPLLTAADNGILARGNGSSYGDCCLNHHGLIIDTSRLNHLLSFDEQSGLLVCQGSVTFADLFLSSSLITYRRLSQALYAQLLQGVLPMMCMAKIIITKESLAITSNG